MKVIRKFSIILLFMFPFFGITNYVHAQNTNQLKWEKIQLNLQTKSDQWTQLSKTKGEINQEVLEILETTISNLSEADIDTTSVENAFEDYVQEINAAESKTESLISQIPSSIESAKKQDLKSLESQIANMNLQIDEIHGHFTKAQQIYNEEIKPEFEKIKSKEEQQ